MKNWKSWFEEGSLKFLLFLIAWYFVCYVGTTVVPKCFTDPAIAGDNMVGQIAYMVYNTIGGLTVVLLIVFGFGWLRHFKSTGSMTLCGITFPREFIYLLPSGICTAVIIPGTTLMYSYRGIDVLAAVVFMRGAVIVIGWVVDFLQKQFKISKKIVFWQEHIAVLFAIGAVILMNAFKDSKGDNLLTSAGATTTFVLYVLAYLIRIYIMNYWRNTREGSAGDNRGYFAVEQIFSATTLVIAFPIILWLGAGDPRVEEMRVAIGNVNWSAVASGAPFGLAAFASVFLLMFKGRNATFSALANRTTSLVAGLVGNIILWLHFGLEKDKPGTPECLGLGLVLIAIVFLALAEYRRFLLKKSQPA